MIHYPPWLISSEGCMVASSSFLKFLQPWQWYRKKAQMSAFSTWWFYALVFQLSTNQRYNGCHWQAQCTTGARALDISYISGSLRRVLIHSVQKMYNVIKPLTTVLGRSREPENNITAYVFSLYVQIFEKPILLVSFNSIF